ncbi:MAG: hypothetical protein K6L76_02095 [Agarilytica sp.]
MFLDKQREIVANQFLDMSDALDRWVSRRDRINKKDNNSYLILNFNSVLSDAGEQEYKARLNAKIDLPNSEDRFKLIFESDPEEDASPQDNERSGKIGNEQLAEDNAIASLEYSLQKKEFQWRGALDIGSRLNLPPDAFVRLKIKKKTQLGNKWFSKTAFDFPWFAQEGAKPSARQSFSYSFTPNVSFRNVTHVKYSAQESLRESYLSFQINHQWSEHLVMEYKLGAYGDSESHNETSAYFAQIGFRQHIYGDWMFLRLVPEVVYPREFDWRAQHAITISLQALYSN